MKMYGDNPKKPFGRDNLLKNQIIQRNGHK